MVSEREKILIEINRDYIKSEQNLSNKIFFGFITVVIGMLVLFFQEPNITKQLKEMEPNLLAGAFFLLIGIYLLMETSQYRNQRSAFIGLSDKVINDDSQLEKYKIDEPTNRAKLRRSALIGWLFGVSLFYLSSNLLILGLAILITGVWAWFYQ